MAVQWVHVGLGEVLLASPTKAWLTQPELGSMVLGGQMPTTLVGDQSSTRNLLDGAIAAAERMASPTRAAPMTALRWAWDLVNQSYIARESVALLERSVERYREAGREDLAGFAQERHEGELGHDRFPVEDLTALGYEARDLLEAVSPQPVARRLIAYATDCLDGEHPVEFLGYIHAMERHAVRAPRELFETLARVLPEGIDAASGLRAHASELDLAHVAQAVAFFSTLPAPDRTIIALGCFRTAQIRCEEHVHPTDEELAERLAPFHIDQGVTT